MPRRGEGRGRLTEGETSELDEHHFDRDIAAARLVKQVRVVAQVGGQTVRVLRAEHRELEVALTEGADHAVLGGSAGINSQRHTGAAVEVVAVTVALAVVAA